MVRPVKPLTHEQVWDALDMLAEEYDMSASGLAKASGLDPTTFNKSKRVGPDGRPRWPSTESISKALQAAGYKVAATYFGNDEAASKFKAETGVDALSVAEKAAEPIDLIVSDVIMPEMDGPTMLTELRRRGLTAKVIFVSGYADDAFARNLPEGQEFVFLPKPFSLKQLIETVKGVMN